jgi:nicotinamide-nucleotide amidase
MQADIITIGDEILIGQVVNTNATFISKTLNSVGFEIRQILSISDEKDAIIKALKSSQNQVDLVVITGGLGPTKDDITKHALCEYFEDRLIFYPEVMTHIEELFKKYVKAPVNDLNRSQAMLPSNSIHLFNEHGTAMGIWMKNKKTVFVSLPGVPFEMKNLIKEKLIPLIKKTFLLPSIVHRTMMIYGLGESIIAEKISNWESKLPKHIKLAYLPNLGRVRLRLSAKGTNAKDLHKEIDKLFNELYPLIGDYIKGFESDYPIETQIGQVLCDKGWTLATAESCSGGSIAAIFTKYPGASSFFKGSVVSYATEIKYNILGVSNELINKYSVVSEPVGLEMAKGILKRTNADVAISTTGNFGPSKGDGDVEIGTVVIAIITPSCEFVETFCFGKHRERNQRKTQNKVLELLFNILTN